MKIYVHEGHFTFDIYSERPCKASEYLEYLYPLLLIFGTFKSASLNSLEYLNLYLCTFESEPFEYLKYLNVSLWVFGIFERVSLSIWNIWLRLFEFLNILMYLFKYFEYLNLSLWIFEPHRRSWQRDRQTWQSWRKSGWCQQGESEFYIYMKLAVTKRKGRRMSGLRRFPSACLGMCWLD